MFEAVAVRIGDGSSVGVWDGLDDWDRIFEKPVRRSDPANIIDVWIQGKRVISQDPR